MTQTSVNKYQLTLIEKISTEWVGKVIHKELSMKLKFNFTKKWYVHNPESVLEKETQKLFWDFKIQTDHLILARAPDFIIFNKKEGI